MEIYKLGSYNTYKPLFENFISPRKENAKEYCCSCVIMYGPPGTGKSGSTKRAAAELGYPFMTIPPGSYVA